MATTTQNVQTSAPSSKGTGLTSNTRGSPRVASEETVRNKMSHKVRTLRTPNSSLKSRLPWLDTKSTAKIPTGSKGMSLTSKNARPSIQARPTPDRIPYSTITNLDSEAPSHSVLITNDGAPTNDSRIDQSFAPLQSSSNPRSPKSPVAYSSGRESITLDMQPVTRSRISAKNDSRSPNSVAGSRSGRSLQRSATAALKRAFSPDPTDSLPEMDTSPLTQAIEKFEGLMKEAEDLVNEAAESGHSSEAEDLLEHSREAIDNTLNTASGMGHDAQRSRPFLISASMSEISLDDHDTTEVCSSPRNMKLNAKGPIVRDFAYSPAQGVPSKMRQSSVHWMGRRPTRTFTAARPLKTLKRPDIPVRHHHTAYVSASPASSQAPQEGIRSMSARDAPATTSRDRNPGPDWQQWQQPRPNTYFDLRWQPSQNENRSHKSRKPSVAPLPWNEERLRRRKHQKVESGTDTTVDADDVEKAEFADDDGGRGRGRGRRWALGHAKSEPIARKWGIGRKRISAAVACFNTGVVGYIIGDYAGMVPRIQFQLADQKHDVLMGNMYVFLGLAVTTFFCWPLPLLHGRRPYILAALGLAIPLQFPQASLVSQFRPPTVFGYEFGLLTCRFITGVVLGLVNINDFATLLDLFGASLQSEIPHQELVRYDDPRRDGGGMGVWLGIWAWCWVGSMSMGFLSGAGVINHLNPQWGFYLSIGFMICVLILNFMVPETRHSSLRRTLKELKAGGRRDTYAVRKMARGEIKLHLEDEGPRYWFEEVWAGVRLCKRMFFQRGFSIIVLYLGWIYGQNVLIIILLGALLSRDYRLPARYVGLGVLSIAIGALLAVPMSHAGLFSRARKRGPRTDSMTFQPQFTWTSHMVRRIVFMMLLPLAGIIYTFVSPGVGVPLMVPIVSAGVMGFLDSLAVAECYGLIMETYDTSDLQPGVNSRHRIQSLADNVRRRRADYSSFPRVSAGIFLSQSIGFAFAAVATILGGTLTRHLGAQYSTGITAGILLFLTILLTGALFRWKDVQVIPDHALGTRVGTLEVLPEKEDEYWKPVVIGNPSGKFRKMSLLELGRMSRWTEIRKLNNLL